MSACPQCQQPIPADAPQGVCPSCLYRMVGSRPGVVGALAGATAKSSTRADFEGSGGASGSNYPTRATRPLAVTLERDRVIAAFPQLEILETLGTGGMGAVYKVRQRALDRFAALKLLSPTLAGDPSFQERFTREARLMARLVHPNIAMIFEFGQADEFFYLLMEFVDGVNLRAAIRGRTIQPEDSLRIVPQICDALQYAHDQGVIHRDIKPENILLDRFGNVKLVDFGLAKLHAAPNGEPTLTGTQQVMGTMNYMAPEQWERPSQIDHRADIFSLGVVFYELLTGELPLGRFSPPSQRAKVDERLDPVVLRTLEKDPNARFQTAGAVKTAVSSVQSSPPVRSSAIFAAPSPAATMAPRAQPLATMPFTVGDDAEHWETNGIATLNADGLRIEFTKRDRWFGTKQGIEQVFLHLSDVSHVELKNGPITKGIELHTKSLMCLRDFPYAKDLSVLLKTKSTHRAQRDQMFAELSNLLGQPLPGYYDQMRDLQYAKSRVQGPAMALLLVGMLDLLACLAALAIVMLAVFWTRSHDLRRNVPAEPPAPVVASTTGEQLNAEAESPAAELDSPSSAIAVEPAGASTRTFGVVIGYLAISVAVIGLWLILGLMQLWGGFRMRQLHSYGTCLTGNILALIPIHPAAIVGIPVGIYGLVVLCDQRVYTAFERVAETASVAPVKKT